MIYLNNRRKSYIAIIIRKKLAKYAFLYSKIRSFLPVEFRKGDRCGISVIKHGEIIPQDTRSTISTRYHTGTLFLIKKQMWLDRCSPTDISNDIFTRRSDN